MHMETMADRMMLEGCVVGLGGGGGVGGRGGL